MSKQTMRTEIEKLTADYHQNGGTITRQREHKTTITCRACGHRRYVSVGYAVTFGRTCIRCGSSTTTDWTTS
jgi:transcription elongation factor Elf1